MDIKKIGRASLRAVSGFLAALAAVTYFSAEMNNLGSVFDFYRELLAQRFPLFLFFFALLIFLGFRKSRQSVKSTVLFELCCIIVAVIWLLGRCFQVDNTLDCLAATGMQKFRSLVYLLGSYALLRESGLAVISLLHSGRDLRPGNGRLYDFYGRHSFLCFFLLLLIISLPTWISCYPGYMCPDSYCQLAYYFGIYEFVAHHPTIHTLFISYCVRLGLLFGSANAGLYIIICIQFICFAAVFAHMLSTMHRLGAPHWLVALSFLITALCPIFLPVAAVVLKDNVFAYAAVLFMTELVLLREMGWDYLRSPKRIILFSLAVAGIMLMRNNGKYLLILFIPVLLIVYCIKAKKEHRAGNLVSFILLLILPVIAASALEKLAVNHYDVAPGSRREAFSIPFQQTARYAFEHGDEVTEEERTVIDKVLQYQFLAEDYTPMCSDNSKCYFVDSSTNAELLDYFRVWLAQGLKYPSTYFKATMNQNYPLFCPFSFLSSFRSSTQSDAHVHISEPLGLHDVEFADSIQQALKDFDLAFSQIPILRLFNSAGFCTLLTMLLCVYALHERNWNFLLISLPGLINLLIVFAAPLVEIRYAFPVIYTMPIVTAFYIHSRKKA